MAENCLTSVSVRSCHWSVPSVEQMSPRRRNMATPIADPHQGDGNEHLPAQAHDLVVAIARERGAEPQEAEQQEADLGQEPAAAPR